MHTAARARALCSIEAAGITPASTTPAHPSPVRRADCGGFDFMPRPEGDYYRKLPARIGKALREEQYKAVEELGLLVDADDQVSHEFAKVAKHMKISTGQYQACWTRRLLRMTTVVPGCDRSGQDVRLAKSAVHRSVYASAPLAMSGKQKVDRVEPQLVAPTGQLH